MHQGPLTELAGRDEDSRLRALEEFGLIDTPPERELDSIAALAAHVLNTPVALVSLVGRDRQFFKAKYGTDLCETPRAMSFCAHALAEPTPLIVLDATKDPRFAANPLVLGAPGIRFYAGAPLVSSSGHILGTVCVIDFEPRSSVSSSELGTLQDLASFAMQQMEMQRLKRMGLDARREREHSNRQFQQLVSSIKDYALYMLSPEGTVASWNAGAQKIKGYTAEEIVGQHYSRFYIEEDRLNGVPQRALETAAKHGRFETDGWRIRKDGSLFWANVIIDAIHDDGGALVGFAKITRDITERRNNEEHLRRLAHTDALTGMANRYFFLAKLDEFIDQGATTVLVIDLDNFKEINDALGHQSGDFLLKAVGNRIEDAIAGKGGAGRLGGDEFAAVLPSLADPLGAAEKSKRIIDAVRRPFTCHEQEIQVGVSIGIAISPNHGTTSVELLANGDLALYHAKSERRTGYCLFQETFRQTILARRNCEQELRRAAAEGELELYFQPQVRLSDRQWIGAEALLRWNHPQRGVLSPGAFLPVLEKSALASQVGKWIIRSACAFAAGVRAKGHEHFCIAINLFGVQFRSGDLVSVVSAALAQHGLPPHALELEITENVILEHEEAVVSALRELSKMGVGAAFDDYGTGYASLSQLKRFPLKRLKIDQSFVRDLCADPEDAAVIKAILLLANSFGLDVVAEGMEHEDQETILREFGCPHGQGYLYARPMRAGDLLAALDGEASAGGEHDLSPAVMRMRS